MMRWFWLVIALLLAAPAWAQNQPVYQSGLVTRGHPVGWYNNGVVGDLEASGGFTQLTLTNTGTPFCINDALISSPSGYHQFCIGANSLGGALISYQAYGGATPLGLQCNINGSVTPCFPSGGNVVGPTSPTPTAGDAVIWNGGVAVKDGGPPTFSVATNAALQALTGEPSGTTVFRQAFWPNISQGAAIYTFTSANCGSPDNGLEVAPTTGGGCWLLDQTGTPGPSLWGATGSSVSITCNASGFTLTCSGGTGDFQKGMPIAIMGAGPTSTVSTPSLALTAVNGSGTTYYYAAVPIDSSMGVGGASTIESVSGGMAGGLLGKPADIDLPLTGNTHGNTTLDNLQLAGHTCTYATCFLVPGEIEYIQNDANIPISTTLNTVNSPTSVVLSTSATTTAAGITVDFHSPAQGVFNELAVSGTASSFALYEGATNSLSSMTCIGVLDGNSTLNNAVRDDYGPNDNAPCPSWLPATPPATAKGQVLRTTIASISGTTITLANAATNAVTGTAVVHDDTTPLTSAINWGNALIFAPGTYNTFAGLTENSPAVIDLQRDAIIAGWGNGFDDLTFGTGSGGGRLTNFEFEDVQKSSNFGLTINGPVKHIIIDSGLFSDPYNSYQLEKANAPVTTNIAVIGTPHGDQEFYLWSPAGTAVVNAYFGNVTVAGSISDACVFINSDVNSTVLQNFSCQQSPGEFFIGNSIAGGSVPFAIRSIDSVCNAGWSGPCLWIQDGNAELTFQRFYAQGVGGIPVAGYGGIGIPGGNGLSTGDHNSCIEIDAGVSPVAIIDHSEIFGCDGDGVHFSGNYLHMGDGSDEVYGNSASQHGVYNKITVSGGGGNTTGPATINLATGDRTSSNANSSPTELCGVSIASGAGTANPTLGTAAYNVSSNAPGIQAPVCDNTGVFGTVRTDGQFNSPTWVTNPSGGTLSVAETLGNQNNTVPIIYVSGNVLGTPVTWTSPTAAAWVAGVTNEAAFINQIFSFEIVNLGGSTVTLGHGTGVTVSGTATTAAGAPPHVYTCQMTNVSGGTQAVTCTG